MEVDSERTIQLKESAEYIVDLVSDYELRREQYEALDKAKTLAFQDMEQAERVLANALGTLPNPTITVGGFRYTPGSKPYFKKMVPDDEFFEVVTEHGLGDLIKRTIHANTLNGALRDVIEENEGVLPDWLSGIVSVYDKPKIFRRKF